MINTVQGFAKRAIVADGFSDLIRSCTAAIGVQALSLNLPLIIYAIVEITT